MTLPLQGIRALDFGMAAVGPISMTYLGFLGADVIKIEHPSGDIVRRPWVITMNGMGTTFIGNNTGKRGIALDLKTDYGRTVAMKMVETADVVLDNFRSREVMESMGLGFQAMQAINPRIIYLQSSAYGDRGPMKGMVSHDPITQAAGGYASMNGPVGGAPEMSRGSARLDWTAAMVNCAGLLIALHVRQKTGRGMMIETNQFTSTICTGLTRYAEYLDHGVVPSPMGSARPNIVPDEAFPTAMGFLSISVLNNGMWSRLCDALGLSDLARDPRFVTNALRVHNREELLPILRSKLADKAAWQWQRLLKAHGVPCSEYFQDKPTGHFLIEHPQVVANEMATTLETPWGPANVCFNHWAFSKSTTHIARPAPELDQHREEILAELGIEDLVPVGADAESTRRERWH